MTERQVQRNGSHSLPSARERFAQESTYAATRRHLSVAETLLPEAYTSEEFFALERERVFGRSWVTIGCAEQVRDPGDVLVADVGGRSVFALRTLVRRWLSCRAWPTRHGVRRDSSL